MPPARDPCTWPHPVTPARGLCAAQLNSWSWVNWTPLHDFAESATSLEHQRSVVSARDVLRDFFCSCWASPFGHLVVLVLLLGWPFYNSKSSKSIGSANPFRKKKRRLLVSSLKLFIWPVQWPDLVLAKALVKTPHRLSASLMSPLNKPQELQLIAMAFALPLSFFFALTASSSALHFCRELFTEPQGAPTNISRSYAPSANTSRVYRLAPPLQLFLLPKSHPNSS